MGSSDSVSRATQSIHYRAVTEDTMADEPTNTPPSIIDGGEPTDQEALLAAQVDTIGDNPTEEPAPAAAKAEDVAAAEQTSEELAAVAAATAAAEKAAADEVEAAAAPAAAAAADATPVAVAAPPPPKPARDFDAAIEENQRRFDEGEIEGTEYQKELRAITKEEAQFTARMEIWTEHQQSAAEHAEREFNDVAGGWEKANADFMANPLRAQQMQAAIVAVNAKTPGLSPAQLFDAAAKITFEAFNWKPVTPTPAVDVKKAEADALAGRKPGGVPPTLAGSPAAAPIEAPATNSTFASLDEKDISTLEDAVARMTPVQRDAYLRDAPGSNSPATNR
jgi:hypothetical protein